MRVKLPIIGAPLLYSSTSLVLNRTGAVGSILLRDYYRNQFGISPAFQDPNLQNLSRVTSNPYYNANGLRKMGSTTWQFTIPGLGEIREFYNDTGASAYVGTCGFNVIYSSLQIDCNQTYSQEALFAPGNVYFIRGYVPFPSRPDYRIFATILTLTPNTVTGTGKTKIGSPPA